MAGSQRNIMHHTQLRRTRPRLIVEKTDFFNPTNDFISFEMPQGGPNDPIEIIDVAPGECYRGIVNYTKFYLRQGLRLGTPDSPQEFKDPAPLIDPRAQRRDARMGLTPDDAAQRRAVRDAEALKKAQELEAEHAEVGRAVKQGKEEARLKELDDIDTPVRRKKPKSEAPK